MNIRRFFASATIGIASILSSGCAPLVAGVVGAAAGTVTREATKATTTATRDVVKSGTDKVADTFKSEATLYEEALNKRGCRPGRADGKLDAATEAAHARLEKANTGEIEKTSKAVLAAPKSCLGIK